MLVRLYHPMANDHISWLTWVTQPPEKYRTMPGSHDCLNVTINQLIQLSVMGIIRLYECRVL